MIFVFICTSLILFHVFEVKAGLTEVATEYFENDDVKNAAKVWDVKYKPSYELTLESGLRDLYGYLGMNMYVRKIGNSSTISNGMHVADNAVNVVLKKLSLRHLPQSIMPQVALDLPSNVVRVEFKLSKMFVESTYLLFRNESALLYETPSDDDFYHFSPFTLHQVQREGVFTIIADDCSVVGTFIATFNGPMVTLGHDAISINNCQLSIEIHTPGQGSPPVIAPYFSAEKSKELMRLMTKPIREELKTKLEAAVISYIKTNHVLETRIAPLKSKQKELMRRTKGIMTYVISNLNKIATQFEAFLQIPDYEVKLTETIRGQEVEVLLTLTNIMVQGLDTAYSVHNGGPYKYNDMMFFSESIRYPDLIVQGELNYGNSSSTHAYKFAADLLDVEIDVTLTLEKDLQIAKLAPIGWRETEFSINQLDYNKKAQTAACAIVEGYLSEQVTSALQKHLKEHLLSAVQEAETQKEGSVEEVNENPNEYDDHTEDNEHETEQTEDNESHSENTEDNVTNNETTKDYLTLSDNEDKTETNNDPTEDHLTPSDNEDKTETPEEHENDIVHDDKEMENNKIALKSILNNPNFNIVPKKLTIDINRRQAINKNILK